MGSFRSLICLPNESQRSQLQGDGQTRYVNRVQNDTVVQTPSPIKSGPLLNVGGCQGLAAYIIDNVDATGNPGGAAATAAQANAAAIAIIAIMDAGDYLRGRLRLMESWLTLA